MKKVWMVMIGLSFGINGWLYGAIPYDSPKSIYFGADGGWGVAMAVKAGDVPCFSFISRWADRVRYTDDLGVTKSTLDTVGWNKRHVAMAIDPDGNAHVVWADANNSAWKIHYRGQTGGVWNETIEVVKDSCGDQPLIDIAADADGVDVIWSVPFVNGYRPGFIPMRSIS